MLFEYLEIGFLIAVVACLIFAAVRVRMGPPELLLHRIGFLVAVLACTVLASTFVRWNAEMEVPDHGWIIELGFAPLWNPPPATYAKFRERYSPFDDEDKLPPEETPGLTITRYPKLEGMVGNLFLYLWSVFFFFGMLYFATRGENRDPLLHYVVGIWCGVSVAGLVFIAFSITRPDEPARRELFGYAGTLGGFLVAARTWHKATGASSENSPDGQVTNSD